MNVWSGASQLSGNFPRKLAKSTGFVERILRFTCQQETFTRLTASESSSQEMSSSLEEGEICI